MIDESGYYVVCNEKTLPKLKDEKHKKFFNTIKFHVNSYMADDVFAIADFNDLSHGKVVIFKIVGDELFYNKTLETGLNVPFNPPYVPKYDSED